MTDTLKGKVAIVTGAARGIGLAICERLAAEGASLIMSDILEDVHERASTLHRSKKVPVKPVVMDVSSEPDTSRLVETALGEHGRIDILVNNAGISPKNKGRKFFVDEITLEAWQQLMAINLAGPFLLCKAVAPIMRKANGGRIINIASQAARGRVEFTSSHYAASKAGLIGLTRTLASELGPYGVTVNSVAPGILETTLTRALSDDVRGSMVARVPLQRMGQLDEIGAAVAFLASDDAKYITGTTLDVNGGTIMM